MIIQKLEQANKPQPEVVISNKIPTKAQTKAEELPNKNMATLQDAALSSIDPTGGRAPEAVPFNPLRPPVTETDIELTKVDQSFVHPA